MASVTQSPYPITHAPALGIRLAGLAPGTPVTLVRDGRRHQVTVRHWSRDGSPDHGQLTVGYGPGRWNCTVTAAGILAGHYDLEEGWDQ